MDLGKFMSMFNPIDGLIFSNRTASYQSLVLAQNAKIVDNGIFYSYASLEVAGLNTDAEAQSREITMDLQPQATQSDEVVLTATTQEDVDLQTPTYEHETSPNGTPGTEMDIVDFKTAFDTTPV